MKEILNVDITYIEKCCKKICESDCGIRKLTNQEIISDRYTEMVAEKCIDMIVSKGIIQVGLLATKLNVPLSYLSNASVPVISVAGSVVPIVCEKNSTIQQKNGDLFTIVGSSPSFDRRTSSVVFRVAFEASCMPLRVQLFSRNSAKRISLSPSFIQLFDRFFSLPRDRFAAPEIGTSLGFRKSGLFHSATIRRPKIGRNCGFPSQQSICSKEASKRTPCPKSLRFPPRFLLLPTTSRNTVIRRNFENSIPFGSLPL